MIYSLKWKQIYLSRKKKLLKVELRVDRGHGKTKFYQGGRVPPVPSGRWGEYTVWQDVRQQDATHSTREEYALWPASAYLPVLQQGLHEQGPNEEAHGAVHHEEK